MSSRTLSKRRYPALQGIAILMAPEVGNSLILVPINRDCEVEKFFNPLPLRGIGEKPNLLGSYLSSTERKKVTTRKGH